MATETRWEDTRRLEGWAGEARINLIRAVALLGLYGAHLVDVVVFSDGDEARAAFHSALTALVAPYAVLVAILHACLVRRWVPPALKYVVTAIDLVLVTAVIAVTPEGPRSYLVILYFLVIAAAPLRLSIPLVATATFGAMAGYMIVMGEYAWHRIGFEEYYTPGPHRIPRVQQFVIEMSLLCAGVLAGQVVRQVRRVASGHAVVVAEPDA